ncbi:ATP-binding cassette domain-containing protein [Fodinicola feengrottensis]|uniref:ATP-binding cassette domain-containing protein n=1 Tax=Fodinicola feengrottensis TaxID=435914 RepID=UPI0024430F1B|nr:ATP-binding cassette domain-containing protein [Fodinicola feengrottensis]
MTDTDMIRAEHVRKRFGPVTAIQDVNLHVRKGEILGLIGDNGAGKSTLIKILTGYHQPDGGQLFFEGEPIHLRSVVHARSLGIETVFQDLAMIDDLPVYLNLHLNKELVHRPLPFLRRKEMRRKAREALDSIGITIGSVTDPVSQLSGGQRQAIAVARSVFSDAKVLLLDEPLAAMGAKEGGLILRLLMQLKERGDRPGHHSDCPQLQPDRRRRVCDRVNLLQHGTITFDKASKDTSVAELLDLVHAEYRL